MTTTNNNIKSIEDDITAIVKESGISKIILQYKSELEDISNCSRCGFKYSNRFWKYYDTGKTFCLRCMLDKSSEEIKATAGDEVLVPLFAQYSSGRHGIYRDVNKFKRRKIKKVIYI